VSVSDLEHQIQPQRTEQEMQTWHGVSSTFLLTYLSRIILSCAQCETFRRRHVEMCVTIES